MINKLKSVDTGNFKWIHLIQPADTDIAYLRDTYQFHPLDLQDCISVNQHPKAVDHIDYVFLVLMFPFYDRHERKIQSSEVDFFIGPRFLVTVSDGKSPMIDSLFEHCRTKATAREQYLNKTTVHLLHELIHRTQEGMLPMLDHMSEDLLSIENQIFTGQEKRMVRDILLIKRNIVNFRRIVNAHKSTLRKLMGIHQMQGFTITNDLAVYFTNILDRTKDIWEILEIQKESINAFQETNDALITFKLNDTLKILTAISVSIFAASLIAQLFSTRAMNIPFITLPGSFYILVGIIIVAVFSILTYFRKRDWL